MHNFNTSNALIGAILLILKCDFQTLKKVLLQYTNTLNGNNGPKTSYIIFRG